MVVTKLQQKSSPPKPDDVVRDLIPGSTGWSTGEFELTASALAADSRFEIVHGVLTSMAPAQIRGSRPLMRLILKLSQSAVAESGSFQGETDIVIRDDLRYVADSVWMSREDDSRQVAAARSLPNGDPEGAVLVPPTLVIESASAGHERHDRVTKFRDYAEFGIPHFWILDAGKKSLDCYHLVQNEYVLEVSGRERDTIRPALFAPLEIALEPLWKM